MKTAAMCNSQNMHFFEPSKICGREPLKYLMRHITSLQIFKGCLPQILGPYLVHS